MLTNEASINKRISKPRISQKIGLDQAEKFTDFGFINMIFLFKLDTNAYEAMLRLIFI